ADTKAFLEILDGYTRSGLLPKLSPEAQVRIMEYSLRRAGYDPSDLPPPTPRPVRPPSKDMPTQADREVPALVLERGLKNAVYLVDEKPPVSVDLTDPAW